MQRGRILSTVQQTPNTTFLQAHTHLHPLHGPSASHGASFLTHRPLLRPSAASSHHRFVPAPARAVNPRPIARRRANLGKVRLAFAHNDRPAPLEVAYVRKFSAEGKVIAFATACTVLLLVQRFVLRC
jgi:hypothetical protein